ncbi:MAG: histidinol-phosphate transaminase [Gammaproteobacteria bacterium]|nr:histidinol-phosphate transaminase [Gammaproteobacteria bacterium]
MTIENLARAEIVAMKPYSSARKEAPGKGILLNANEAPWSLLESAMALNRYPDPQPERLVQRLAALYGTEPQNVLVTRGSDEGIDLLTRVFCRAGQDAILQTPPAFGMYRIAAQTQGASVVSVPRDSKTFTLDEAGVLDALKDDPRIKLVYLTSPSNPTGDVVTSAFLDSVLETAEGRALVVVDEAYAEFSNHPSFVPAVGENEHLVVLRTLSKAWASAGLRCGTVIAQPSVISLLRRIIAPYPLPSPVVSLALAMLDEGVIEKQGDLLRQLRHNKGILLGMLEARSFVRGVVPGEANFVLIRVDDAEALLGFCARRDVILRGFPADPALQNCIRISVGSTDDLAQLKAAFDAWEKRL